MKWILGQKYFTAKMVKLIDIVIHPKTKKEQKSSLAVWELRHINSCRLIIQALRAFKLDMLAVIKLLNILGKKMYVIILMHVGNIEL